MRVKYCLTVAISLLAPTVKAPARNLFYFLVGDSIQTYTMDGVHQETFQLTPFGHDK